MHLNSSTTIMIHQAVGKLLRISKRRFWRTTTQRLQSAKNSAKRHHPEILGHQAPYVSIRQAQARIIYTRGLKASGLAPQVLSQASRRLRRECLRRKERR